MLSNNDIKWIGCKHYLSCQYLWKHFSSALVRTRFSESSTQVFFINQLRHIFNMINLHWFRSWLGACSAPSRHLHQWWHNHLLLYHQFLFGFDYNRETKWVEGHIILPANPQCSQIIAQLRNSTPGHRHMASALFGIASVSHNELTHWGRDKMVAIFQTIFSNPFSWMKMFELRLRFHWRLVLRVQLTISQHWFR